MYFVRSSAKMSRESPDPTTQIWRMYWPKRWLQSLTAVGIFAAASVWAMYHVGIAFGLLYAPLGIVWAWFVCWLPKATLTSDELRVVNRFRTRRIPLEEVHSRVELASCVTFELNDGQRVRVAAINGWYAWQRWWFPSVAKYGTKFADAVFAAKRAKEELRE